WFAKSKDAIKYRQLYFEKVAGDAGAGQYTWAETTEGLRLNLGASGIRSGDSSYRIFTHDNITSQRPPGSFPVSLEGNTFVPSNGYWKTGVEGMSRLQLANRLMFMGNTLRYVRYLDDFAVSPINNIWDDTVTSGFADKKVYVVQTHV